MKFCEVCGDEISTKDGENRCDECEGNLKRKRSKEARKQAREEREEALRSCGLVKVKGALGGTYWE